MNTKVTYESTGSHINTNKQLLNEGEKYISRTIGYKSNIFKWTHYMKNLFSVISVITILISCNPGNSDIASGDYYYTCSMHPQIHENHPGLCPICHMDLIKVKKTQSAPDEITLNEDQIRLGNVIVDTISMERMGNKQIITATLNADESRTESVAARMNGRIDRLYFKTEGEYVRKGQPLFSLYSEELNNAKQELIALIEKKKVLDNEIIDFDKLIEATRQKLLLLGITEAQTSELINTGKSSPLTTFYSPVSGYITELFFAEGEYIPEGSMVMRVADFSKLWVEAQMYASQMAWLPENSVVDIEFPDLPGKKVSGKISFISPELLPDTRLLLARVEINNPDGKLRPGMAAYVINRPQLKNVLTMPVDAVIRDGKKNIVWLQKDSTTFKYKQVQTGAESNHRITITSGLEEGDKVVMSGVYLLNSEYLLKKGM